MNPPSLPTRLHAGLFAAVVLIVALAAVVRAGSFQPTVDQKLIDGRMARAFETHYDQQFPVRNFALGLWTAIQYQLFDEAATGVVIGRDGWLYTLEEFQLGNQPEREVQKNIALIAAVRDRLAARGIDLVVAVVPAKASIYPEHLGRRQPPSAHRRLHAQLLAGLQRQGVVAADLAPTLRAGKADGLTYFRTDTHWTPMGARRAADAIAARVREAGFGGEVAQHYHRIADDTVEHRGDLFNFLPLRPYFGWLEPPPDRLRQTRSEPLQSGGLLDESPAPKVALVGTSYSVNPRWNFDGSLREALREDLLNVAQDGRGPFNPMSDYLHGKVLQEAPPRLVIWELPERYLPTPQRLDPVTLKPIPEKKEESHGHS